LIRQGAALCEGAEDVLRALEGIRGLGDTAGETWRSCPPEPDDGLRARLAALLCPTPVSRDDLVRAAGAPTPVVMAALTELALAGRAELLPGGMVCAA
jgi:DNA processing protein